MPDPSQTAPPADSRRVRTAIALGVALLVALPFLVVTFPPLTDLAQHTAQFRLFLEALGDPSTPYKIQWLTPYSLFSAVIGAAWALFGPAAAGRVGAMAVVVAGALAIHWLAARRQRPAAAAALGSLFLFSHVLYWGFLSFVAGFPLFVLWIEWERRSRDRALTASAIGRLAVLSLALYFAHALWFAAAAGWLVFASLAARPRLPWSTRARRSLALVPGAALAAAWFPRLEVGRFASEPIWGTWGFGRLRPGELGEALLGGLTGWEESLLLACLAIWLGAGVWQHRHALGASVDRDLALLAAVLFAAALFLPDKYMNTIRFAQRWLPPAATFALLALPAPRVRWRQALALVLTGAFLLSTAIAWWTFDRRDMAGFKAAIAALPERPRLLGLDYARWTPGLAGQPFFQMFAYGQALRGGELNFSFADFAPSLVVYRTRRIDALPWTSGLEWFPQGVRVSDMRWFDHVLIHGHESAHERVADRTGLERVAGEGWWVLYRVSPPEP